VYKRIGEEIAEDLPQSKAVARGRDAVVDLIDCDLRGVHRRQIRQDIAHNLREIHYVMAKRQPFVEAGEQQQILDESRHAGALLSNATERIVDCARAG
jgi:uridine kinase